MTRPDIPPVSAVLLQVLACPCDRHGPLAQERSGSASAWTLRCTVCGRRFPVRDGIPVLLLDAAIDEQR